MPMPSNEKSRDDGEPLQAALQVLSPLIVAPVQRNTGVVRRSWRTHGFWLVHVSVLKVQDVLISICRWGIEQSCNLETEKQVPS